MNYTEFTYAESSCVILRTRDTYTRKEGARSWPKTAKQDKIDEYVPASHYQNFITAIPFFNNFGGHAYCRASWEYTTDGYLPTTVTTVSPDGTVKHVDHFDFVPCSLYYAKRDAGFRERDVLDNCATVEATLENGHRLLTFTHRDGEHTATWDETYKRWVG